MSAAAANGSSDSTLAKEGVRLLLTNQFTAAKRMYDEQYAADPKVALLHSFLSYGNAISSYSEADLKACIESCKRTNGIGEKLEKSGKTDAGKKIEGLLIQADCDLLTALIMLVEETYVKMMWNMRKSFQGYQEVAKLVEKYSGPNKAELAGWSKFGLGLFNVLLSQLPPSVNTIAEMIGFEGDRDRGLKLLTECQEGPSFNAPFAGLLLLVYYLTIAPLTGDEVPGGMDHAKSIIDVSSRHTAQRERGEGRRGSGWGHKNFPNGIFFSLMESRYWRAINQTQKAIEVAKEAAPRSVEMPSAEILFHYQTAWCYFFCLDWQRSAEDFDKLLHSTLNGSYAPPGAPKPATTPGKAQKEPTQASAQGSYAYQCGLCYAMLEDWHKAAWYMESVPVWLKKAGGEPKEVDLYAKRKAAEFLDRLRKRRAKEDVLLDIMDLLNAWNGFSQMPKDALDRAEEQLNAAKAAVQAGKLAWDTEDLVRWELALSCILSTKGDYKGVYAHLKPLSESQKAFLKDSRAKKIGLNAFFYYELANTCFHLGDVAAAREWHKKSAKSTGYDLAKQLAVRLHTLKLKIKAAEGKAKK